MQVFDCGTFPERELVLGKKKSFTFVLWGCRRHVFFVYHMSLQLAYIFGILAPVQTFYNVKP